MFYENFIFVVEDVNLDFDFIWYGIGNHGKLLNQKVAGNWVDIYLRIFTYACMSQNTVNEKPDYLKKR